MLERISIAEALAERVKDTEKDQKSNREGREAGRKNPDGSCGDIFKDARPDGLPEIYW